MHRTFPASLNHYLRSAVATVVLLVLGLAGAGAEDTEVAQQLQLRDQFVQAWSAARDGPRGAFEQLGPALEPYILFPYWQYEDYRHRRAAVPAAEMADFLDRHRGWAFTGSLERSWLRSLGQAGRWTDVARHGAGQSDAELACYHARARLATGDTDGLLAEAQALWAVGKSQPDACDPLFAWLLAEDGITRDLAWQRIRLAMDQGNPRLTLYLARFLPTPERSWLERWQKLSTNRYRQLDQALAWPDQELPRMIAAHALRKLAHYDSATALALFTRFDQHYDWSEATRAAVMHELALMAAVDLEPAALAFIHDMPADFRDDQLVQWWARLAMARQDWPEVLTALAQLGPESAGDERWQYWRARALQETGQPGAAATLLNGLARSASYYGFLAADVLRQPYTICPEQPAVSAEEVAALASRPAFARALELRAAGIDNWSLAEWNLATAGLEREELQHAAALAQQVQWPDRAIFALGNSGDLRWYEWRFPLLWQPQVRQASTEHQLDPAWVLGVMRSESAMIETARSSAGAMGLMQVTPATATQISRQHGLPYQNSRQLLDAEFNIRFGSVYLRQLLDQYGQNPVLVAGAYNAGPNAVERWLRTRPGDDPAIWIETLPYYETRDYIPRVLAFTTLYNWRLQEPVLRVSSRMPGIESGNMAGNETTQVVCQVEQPGLAAAAH